MARRPQMNIEGAQGETTVWRIIANICIIYYSELLRIVFLPEWRDLDDRRNPKSYLQARRACNVVASIL